MAATVRGITLGRYSDSVDAKDDEVTLLDNKKIYLGTGNDLQLHHDGTHSYIINSTNAFKIKGDLIRLNSNTGDEEMLAAHLDGAVELYHDATKKLETTSSGINIGGNLAANPFDYLRFGASQHGAADIRPVDESSHKVGLAFYVDGTADTTINPTEKVRIQAGGGISFNGDSAAANAIDDYEEGSWTPDVKIGGATTGMTYNSSPAGVYTKIGRQVTVRFGWDWSSKGSATGALQVRDLPFTSTHTAYNHFTGSVITFNGPNADGSMTAYLSSTNINFRMHNEANLNVSPTQADFDDDTKVMGTVTYFV
jgi:hypothetical protein